MTTAGSRPVRVLCIDHEGGHGGSSRSLYHAIEHIDRGAVAPEVWCRRAGAVETWYQALGVPCRVVPGMPSASVVARPSRNLAIAARAVPELWRARTALSGLAEEVNARFDVVHLNHIGLWPEAAYLRARTRARLVMHIRTKPEPSVFSRAQARIVSRSVDHAVFITENEEAHFRALGSRLPGTVIYNIAPRPAPEPRPIDRLRDEGRLKVLSVSNFSWKRGLDRLADIAEEVARRGRRDTLFVMAGTMTLKGPLPGLLGEVKRHGGTFADYVAARGLADMFLFLGHVPEIEAVLSACDLVIKPAREPSPWGRDVIEAMAYGKPVLAIGTWDRFVETDVTGYLQPSFDAAAMAERIVALGADSALRARMAETARRRVAELCDGPARAAELVEVWQRLARR